MRHFIRQITNAFLFHNVFIVLAFVIWLLLSWHNLALSNSQKPKVNYHALETKTALAVRMVLTTLTANQALEQALHNGVPLDFVLEVQGLQFGFLGSKHFEPVLEHKYRLLYHNLAQQYVVIDLNHERLESFRRLDTALAYLGEEKIVDLPVSKLQLHDPQKKPRYRGRLRFRLDNRNLPLLLRSANLLSNDWTFQSRWLSWTWPQ